MNVKNFKGVTYLNELPFDKSKIRKYHNVRSVIEEFVDSKSKYCEFLYDTGDYVNAKSAASSLYKSARRYNYNISVLMWGNRIFMRKDY